ncbi:MAG: hypothetical protein WCY15_10915 [Phenylobacterium sp.]|uniref:hypothetical protein n=1 Tax=Phenylobacterium sp. TaxID=1871053 RepID=UPI002A368A95|nr:hypothetical protein [Phenylobacterium sp.]MDX9996698.1 hypothetical protein [Phenylobacterium sp.]
MLRRLVEEGASGSLRPSFPSNTFRPGRLGKFDNIEVHGMLMGLLGLAAPHTSLLRP